MSATPLVRKDVNYLAFEGGGGAGNAYPGALTALEQLGIIGYDSQRATLKPEASLDLTKAPIGINWRLCPVDRAGEQADGEGDEDRRQGQILGVSGASAGAINALFLSLGYTPKEIEHILQTNNFDKFFDPIIPGLNPHVGGYRQDYTSYDLAGFYEEFSATTGGTLFNALTAEGPLAAIRFGEWAADMAGMFMGSVFVTLLGLLTDLPETAILQLSSKMPSGEDTASFLFDFGLFPGLAIRQFFAKYISLAVERILQHDPSYNLQPASGGQYGPSTLVEAGVGRVFRDSNTNTDVRTSEITFRQHQQIFKTQLVVTGSNLETQKSHFFSAETTPNFRVVDAVRISMSLPGAFKPMVIHDDADLKPVINPGENLDKHYLKGVWADGGLLNNIPVAAFDNIAGGQNRTLGLVVGVDEPTPITNIFGFLHAWPYGFCWGTGNSQLSATTMTADRIIILDTHDPLTGESLGLFSFTVDPTLYTNINAQSYGTVMTFFATRVK